MKQNTKIMIGALVIVLAIGFLFISGFSGNTSEHVTIADLAKNSAKYDGKYIQTEGKLVPDSVKWDSQKVELRFAIADGGQQIEILWNDVKPDNFSGDVIAMVSGKYKAGQEFKVDTLTTKCPSKYESAKGEIK